MRIATRAVAVATLVAAMAAPAAATAGGYPPASDPGKGPDNPPSGGTLKVCKKGCRYRSIQKAIDAAGKGTTIRVGNGTYREGLKILSPAKDRVKLIGNAKAPGKVVLEGRGLKGSPAQNGVQVNNADNVTINGFTARHYKGNGFFAANVNGYNLTNLVADTTGVYGVYAFNSKGGKMSNSEAFYNNDAGFYVGQTPPQTKPRRTTLKNLSSWGNALGYSGTNSRYVTITRSKFFNNGVGIVPNVLDSEKFMPHEDNAIVDNDIFWNNFNYYAGAPFPVREGAEGLLYPVGTGVLLFGGRTARVENNRIWGNYLLGYGQISQFLLDDDDKPLGLLEGNEVRGNAFGLGGDDLNGRDLFYDGSGSSNCFENNTLLSPNVPSDNSTFSACGSPNAFNEGARNEAITWVSDSSHEAYWVRNPHKAISGIQPLERWSRSYQAPKGSPAGSSSGGGSSTGSDDTTSTKNVVEVGDYYFAPAKLTVKRNSIVSWKWPSSGGDGHDVALRKGPKGAAKFRSDVFFADETYRRRLKVAGTYSIYCTLHPVQMRQTITVK